MRYHYSLREGVRPRVYTAFGQCAASTQPDGNNHLTSLVMIDQPRFASSNFPHVYNGIPSLDGPSFSNDLEEAWSFLTDDDLGAVTDYGPSASTTFETTPRQGTSRRTNRVAHAVGELQRHFMSLVNLNLGGMPTFTFVQNGRDGRWMSFGECPVVYLLGQLSETPQVVKGSIAAYGDDQFCKNNVSHCLTLYIQVAESIVPDPSNDWRYRCLHPLHPFVAWLSN